ncbi:MAG: hypothetical protein CM1200mP20_08910 [Pseudomonadota bacterium]|nr:MAG: hypothetical protein CM1200mP20_08910 [Pseudomonadota bacterium]
MIGDTSALGYNMLTGGSRVTFAGGIAIVGAAEDLINQLRERAGPPPGIFRLTTLSGTMAKPTGQRPCR